MKKSHERASRYFSFLILWTTIGVSVSMENDSEYNSKAQWILRCLEEDNDPFDERCLDTLATTLQIANISMQAPHSFREVCKESTNNVMLCNDRSI